MHWIEQIHSPGEHATLIDAPHGVIESLLTVPTACRTDYMVFLGHPHSLQGGTMNNKVITTLVRLFKEMQLPSLRINFRGVGQSTGAFDNGQGESDDLLFLVQQWRQCYPQSKIIYAGFSFGSYVTYRAASQSYGALLVSIAPPVNHFNFQEWMPEMPWIIVQGLHDDVVPASMVESFAQARPPIQLLTMPDAGHFFHGQLIILKEQLKHLINITLCDLSC